jgi:hypothetical protein
MEFFSLCHHFQTGSGAYPVSYPVGTVAPATSPPSSAKVKNMWNYTSTLPCLHGVLS